MTVDEYRKYKKGEPLKYLIFKYKKYKYIYSFWNTNPTEAQEYLRSEISHFALYSGLITGFLLGFILGAMWL